MAFGFHNLLHINSDTLLGTGVRRMAYALPKSFVTIHLVHFEMTTILRQHYVKR
jgi:hypothetical protein